MRLLGNIMILTWLLADPRCSVARADGGRVALVERHGEYRISVFTSPNPLRAGPLDVSVLLQDAKTDQPIADAQVFVSLTPRNGSAPAIHAIATSAAATNKLMRAALVDLPAPGLWDVEVICQVRQGPIRVQFAVEAGQQLPAWLTVWPWFCWPLGVVLLFGIHRRLVQRKQAT